MQYYRRPINSLIDDPNEALSKNPSTIADLHATLAIIHALDDYIAPIAKEISCDLHYLAEETRYRDWFRQKLPNDTFHRILTSNNFFSYTSGIRVIIDGIDGTGNFLRGIPLFCSSAAIFIDDRLCISALYDPVHHVVYSGMLPGPDSDICKGAEAWEWQVSTNQQFDLIQTFGRESYDLSKEAIGIHFTRNSPAKLHDLIHEKEDHVKSTLERLSNASGGLYAFNSGLTAMIAVARGAFGAYINHSTYPWDIAAGEVLVRACGGNVTDFDQHAISYDAESRINVIAARKQLYSEIVKIVAA